MEYIIGIALLIVGFVIGIAIRGLIDKKRQIPETCEKFENPAIENFLNQKEEEPLWDIVYVLRNDIDDSPEELRYSLRSLENFRYNKVWFAGGQPKFLRPDRALSIDQKGRNKWEKVCYTLRKICENEEISASNVVTYKVTTKLGSNIRAGAGTNYKIIGSLTHGKTFKSEKQSGNWAYSSQLKGWVCIKSGNNTYLTKI